MLHTYISRVEERDWIVSAGELRSRFEGGITDEVSLSINNFPANIFDWRRTTFKEHAVLITDFWHLARVPFSIDREHNAQDGAVRVHTKVTSREVS